MHFYYKSQVSAQMLCTSIQHENIRFLISSLYISHVKTTNVPLCYVLFLITDTKTPLPREVDLCYLKIIRPKLVTNKTSDQQEK